MSVNCREKSPIYEDEKLVGFMYGRRFKVWQVGPWELRYWKDPLSTQLEYQYFDVK